MIWSVSTLARSSGATRPVKTVNRSIESSPLANVDEMAGDRRRCGHLRAHKMGPAAGALTALEIAVRSRSTPLARIEPVRVHAQAHRTPGLPPFEPGVLEDPVTTLASLTFEASRRPRTIAAAARRSSMRELVHEPMKTLSMRMLVMGVLGLRPM